MATNTFQSGGVDLKWSTVGNWSGGHVPIATEDVVIPTGLAAVVDVARIPATGTLLSLTSAGTGTMTIDMTVQSVEIVSTTIKGATGSGFILPTGSTANTLTITTGTGAGQGIIGGNGVIQYTLYHNSTAPLIIVGNVTGGSGSTAIAVINQLTAPVTITGNVIGGGASGAYGLKNISTGTVNVTGNLTGGTANGAHALYSNSTGAVTLSTGCCMNNPAAGGLAYAGLAGGTPTWSPTAAVTIKYGASTFALQVAASNLRSGITNGEITGTLIPTSGIL